MLYLSQSLTLISAPLHYGAFFCSGHTCIHLVNQHTCSLSPAISPSISPLYKCCLWAFFFFFTRWIHEKKSSGPRDWEGILKKKHKTKNKKQLNPCFKRGSWYLVQEQNPECEAIFFPHSSNSPPCPIKWLGLTHSLINNFSSAPAFSCTQSRRSLLEPTAAVPRRGVVE